jgi:CubicO group peptidase (beta-lactamase class C family)
LLSTVDDLRTWHAALVRGAIISDSLVARSTTPVLGDYGLGWQVIEALDRPMHNHTGGISGFASHLAWYPAQQLLIVLLSNMANDNVKAIACDVARIVFQEDSQPSAARAWLDRPTPVRCAQRPLP